MPRGAWHVRLGMEAEQDFAAILRWTAQRFGTRQARRYEAVLTAAILELATGPDVLGSRARDEILPGLRTLHVARGGQRGRHFLMYRVDAGGGRAIEIVRILHDAMEPARHLPSSSGA